MSKSNGKGPEIDATPPTLVPDGWTHWFQSLSEDVDAALRYDPAAKNRGEVILSYPGLHALWTHRLAHRAYLRGSFTLARFISHFSRFITGVEIHPGAQIGRGVFIDHGMGVVIGETAIVGDGCLIYKGVVLGGTRLEPTHRHPTLGRGVVVGTNACILGAITVGDGARVGSGSVVIRDVPAHATVVGVPGRSVAEQHTDTSVLDHANLPDPVVDLLRNMSRELDNLRNRLSSLEAESVDDSAVDKQS